MEAALPLTALTACSIQHAQAATVQATERSCRSPTPLPAIAACKRHRSSSASHAAMSLDAHGSGKICFSTPVRIVTASLLIQPQSSHRRQDDSAVNGSLAGAMPADQRVASQPQNLVPSEHAKASAATAMPQLPGGTTARGRPRSGRPQRAAAKPAPISDLDSEEDDDYEVRGRSELMCNVLRSPVTYHNLTMGMCSCR